MHVHVIPTNNMGQLSFANAASHVDPAELEAAAAAIRSTSDLSERRSDRIDEGGFVVAHVVHVGRNGVHGQDAVVAFGEQIGQPVDVAI